MAEPEIGKPAPAFALPAAGGGTADLAALKGRKVVLYFYPKDDTPGCTTEAIDFTAAKADFEKAGAVVVGCSKDSVASHEKFAAKHKLDLVLASDAEGAACEAYGVWVEKMNYGKKYMGIERATFLIAADGTLARAWRKVKVKGHVAEVLEAARAA
ncbi:peroxiredoxin [Zavarzinia sp. CC-PAN008]|uniref:peroxiredoxin n=1 Tax=Zavarzinia sp. CC-PAN008 TaxID=3243332 RepID=UPI003F743868